MFYKTSLRAAVVAAFLFLMAGETANALQYGDYLLHNHRGGGIAPPLYGLRLDGLVSPHRSTREFTFDFESNGALMEMRYDAGGIHIYGQAWGGLDTGATHGGTGTDAPRLWDIDFLYDTGVIDMGSSVEVRALTMNTGTISSDLGIWSLEDFHMDDPATGVSFYLGTRHRGNRGLSGWGWLNHCDNSGNYSCSHMAASDWLFEAKFIPEPGSLVLIGLGLAAFAVGRRRA